MLRFFVGILVTIFLITFIRAVVGLIGKAVAQLFEAESQQSEKRSAKGGPAAGQLVQDPVCGIYVSTETKLRKTVAGKTHYFCSESCRNKFHDA